MPSMPVLKPVPATAATPSDLHAALVRTPSVFPLTPQPVARLGDARATLPTGVALVPGAAPTHPARSLQSALELLTMALSALGIAKAELDEHAPDEAKGVASAYRFANAAARRAHGLLEAQIADAWRAFDGRRRRGLPMVTERQMIAHGLTRSHMRPRRAWRKAAEWMADGGLYTKVRGVVKTTGAQGELKAFRNWAWAHSNRIGAYGRIPLSLTIDDASGGGIRVQATSLDGDRIALGWLNPAYVPALRPLVEAGRVTATVRSIPAAPDYDVVGCIVRLAIVGLADPLAAVETTRLRTESGWTPTSPADERTIPMMPVLTDAEAGARYEQALAAVSELF